MKYSILRPNTEKEPKLIAHRGLAVKFPPNSLPAFAEAGKCRFWAIETDVRKTKDGILVCNHNPEIDATYDGSGEIADMTYAELAKFRRRDEKEKGLCSADDLRMPLFREYLEICRQYHALPFIETKTPDIEEVLGEAGRYFAEDEIIVSSIRFEHLLLVRRISRKIFIHHIFSSEKEMERIGELRYGGVSYNCTDLSAFPEKLLKETHEHGVLLCLRAGDSAEAVKKMIAAGLDYIPTNCVKPESLA